MPDNQSPTLKQSIYPEIQVPWIKDPNRWFAIPLFGYLAKIILLIPVSLELLILYIVSGIIFFINSFFVLFTGKYWIVAYELSLGMMRLQTKIAFYFWGLTNEYPGFSFDNNKTVSLDIPMPQNPNRWFAVPFFGGIARLILLIPFRIYQQVISGAATMGAVAAFVPVLFQKYYPESFYELEKDATRLQQSDNVYMSGLSDTYPSFAISMDHQTVKVILIIFAIIGVLYNIFLKIPSMIRLIQDVHTLSTQQKQPDIQPSQSSLQTVEGSISWVTPVEVTNTPLTIINKIVSESKDFSSDPANAITGFSYYYMGKWISGEFANDPLYYISVTHADSSGFYQSKSCFCNAPEFIPATIAGDKIVLFTSYASSDLVFDTSNTPSVVLDSKNLPGLLSKHDIFSITVNGQTKNFEFSPESTLGLFPLENNFSNYSLVATFGNGQKFYKINQPSTGFSWSNLQDVYIATDLDGRILQISGAQSSLEDSSIASRKNNKWILPPDLYPEITMTALNSKMASPIKNVNDVSYFGFYTNDCQIINIKDLARGRMFDPETLQLVMTSGQDKFYTIPSDSQILQSTYHYLVVAAENQHITPNFDRYVKSYPILIEQDAFGTYSILFRDAYLNGGWGCGKPVIYLYPPKQTQVSVRFADTMDLTKTVPVYANGWDVLANPDGTLITPDGKSYPNLFWEGFTYNQIPPLTEGFVVSKNDMQPFLETKLSQYGLNATEKHDFISFWLPFLQTKPYYEISFYTTEQINSFTPLSIYPKPDSMLRILMKYQGLNTFEAVAPQPNPTPFVRNGFTVVEWGGIFN